MDQSGEIMAMQPWQVEALRFSFLNTMTGVGEQDFSWTTLTSSEPDTISEKRALGLRTEEGAWLSGHLVVNKQHGRIDVIYSALPKDTPLPDAGSFFELMEAVKPWYARFKSIGAKRFGFGGVVLLPVESVASGYEQLKSFLPFVKFESDMSDFFLQVNRKKNISGLSFNELSKWSCIEIKAVQITEAGVTEQGGVHAVRLEFDINNAELIDAADEAVRLEIFKCFDERVTSLATIGAK